MRKKLLRPMPIAAIRRLILAAILCILLWNITYWIGEAKSKILGVIWGIATAAAAVVCRYQASKVVQVNKRFILWMSIPGILILVPFVIHLVGLFKERPSGWVILWQMAPLFISLIIPVGLLALAYGALSQHLPPEDKAGEKSTSVSA